MSLQQRQERLSLILHWTLRIAVCMCFVGHGAFGIRQKVDWLVFFDRFLIPHHIAFAMMPLIGTFDITMGILGLIRPTKVVLGWMAFWGIFTALLRPAVGMPFWEAIERAGNFGPAIVLYMSCGPGWFSKAGVLSLADAANRLKVERVLRVTTALLMVGHGMLGVGVKKGLLKHWGLAQVPVQNLAAFTRTVGAFEVASGLIALRWPWLALLVGISVWKMATETLFMVAGDPFWEWIERGGSYLAPLALAMVILSKPAAAKVSAGVPQSSTEPLKEAPGATRLAADSAR